MNILGLEGLRLSFLLLLPNVDVDVQVLDFELLAIRSLFLRLREALVPALQRLVELLEVVLD